MKVFLDQSSETQVLKEGNGKNSEEQKKNEKQKRLLGKKGYF